MDLVLIRIAKELLELYDSITPEELAERIGISLSSVRHRMSEVRKLFGKYGITVTSVSNKGIKIEASEVLRNNMYNFIQGLAYSTPETKEYRKDYILKTLFEYSDNYTVQLFAEDLYVSKKVISGDLKDVKEFLAQYNVDLIIKRNRGVMMEGNEFDVRQAMISHYNSLWWYKKYDEKPLNVDCRISRRAWTYMKNMYGDLNLLDIQRALLDIEKELGVIWTDIAFSRLLEYVVISKRRIQKNWIINNENAHELLPIDMIYYQAAEKVMKQITAREVSLLEVKYLAARIYVAETVYSRETVLEPDYYESVDRYLRRVGMTLGCRECAEDRGLVSEICEILSILQYKENYNIVDWNDSNREVRQNAGELYAVCLMHMDILQEATGLTFAQDDVARITMLVKNYMQDHRKKAVLVTAADTATAAWQLGELRKRFPEIVFTESVHYRYFEPQRYTGQTIISTVNLKRKGVEPCNITKHVNEEDIGRLAEWFEAEKEAETCECEWLLPISENLEFEISAKDKADVIWKVCELLRERGVIDETFEDRLNAQEERISSMIGNKMAMPHVFADDLSCEFVAIVKLNHRVQWDKKEAVKILIVTAVHKNHVNDTLKVLLKNRKLIFGR